ncbi:unnamed protein product [Gordionus sp. m RMFG-2023]|uniref:putative uncharacterized protein DDB_G0277255 isoform X2 n=1 Tax=Gordionus sp. m RMFG-2023 TaxID=3053472 RepID=UPI0030E5227F
MVIIKDKEVALQEGKDDSYIISSRTTANSEESQVVLVTGATGYTAGHVIKLLLEKGYRIKATYRKNAENEAKIQALKKNLGLSDGDDVTPVFRKKISLDFMEADSNDSFELWKDIVKGCTYVVHLAGPIFAESMDKDSNILLASTKQPDIDDDNINVAKDINKELTVNDKDKELLPVPSPISADQRIIDLAVNGILNLLKACKHSKTVKRVVLTSSFSAIIGNPSLIDSSKEYSESDWTQCSGADDNTLEIYPKIKTLSERVAWNFLNNASSEAILVDVDALTNGESNGQEAVFNESAKVCRKDEELEGKKSPRREGKDEEIVEGLSENTDVIYGKPIYSKKEDDYKFELVVMNPVVVLGPSVTDSYTGAGFELMKKLMRRDISAIPKINFLIIDVRDVALAHYKGMITPQASGQRFLLCNRGIWLKEIANVINKEFKSKGYTVPTLQCPSFMASLLKGFFDKTLKHYLPFVGKEIHCSNHNMREILQIIPRELHQTIVDMAQDLIDNGQVSLTQIASVNGAHLNEADSIIMNGNNTANVNTTTSYSLFGALTKRTDTKKSLKNFAKNTNGDVESSLKLLKDTSGSTNQALKTDENDQLFDTNFDLSQTSQINRDAMEADKSNTIDKSISKPLNKLHHSMSMSRVKLFGKGWQSLLHNSNTSSKLTTNKEEMKSSNSNPGSNSNTLQLDGNKDSSELVKDDHQQTPNITTVKSNSLEGAGSNKDSREISSNKKGAGGNKVAKKKWSLHYHHNYLSTKRNNQNNMATNSNEKNMDDGKEVSKEPSNTDNPGKVSSNEANTVNPTGGGGILGLSGMAKCFPHYFKSLVMDDKCGNSGKSNQQSKGDNQDNSATSSKSNTLEQPSETNIFQRTNNINNNANFITYIDSHSLNSQNNNNSNHPNLPNLGNISKKGLGSGGHTSPPPVVLISSRPITPESEKVLSANQYQSPINQNYGLSDVKMLLFEGNSNAMATDIVRGAVLYGMNPYNQTDSNLYHQNPNINNYNNSQNGSNTFTASTTYQHCRKESLSKNFVSSIQGVSLSNTNNTSNETISITNNNNQGVILNGYHHENEFNINGHHEDCDVAGEPNIEENSKKGKEINTSGSSLIVNA